MRIAIFVCWFVFPLSLTCGDDALNSSAIVATVGGKMISKAELKRAMGERALGLETELYRLQREVLDELIVATLFGERAKQAGLSVESFVDREIRARIRAATSEEVSAIYEASRERFVGMADTVAKARIKHELEQRREAEERKVFIASLQASQPVCVMLEAPRAKVLSETGPSRGSGDAPVTIVEYSDFECPFCAKVQFALSQLQERYPKKIRLVFRQAPSGAHPLAFRAAEASLCAMNQDAFWPMHDRLFSHGGQLTEADLTADAEAAGLDMAVFRECLQSHRHAKRVEEEKRFGMTTGVRSTPTFFVNGRYIVGAESLESFSRLIEEELNGGCRN